MYLALYGPEGLVIFDHPYNGGSARGYLGDLSHRLRSGIVSHNGTIASVP